MLIKILTSKEFWTISIPAICAILVWILNERSKKKTSIREIKQECYSSLLVSISGLLEHSKSSAKASDFIDNLNKLWIYAPDKVVKAVNAYVQSMMDDSTEKIRSQNLRQLVITMRLDIQSKTKLHSKEYLQVSPFQDVQQ